MKIDKRRVWRTFLQSFFGSLSINIASLFVAENDRERLVIAILSVFGTAITTGMAAVMNIEYEEDETDEKGDEE